MAVSSRLAQYEKRQALKSAAIYIILTAVILFLLTKFGPLIVTSITGVIAPDSSTPMNRSTLVVAPPQINDLPGITNQKILNLHGSAQSGITIRLTLNGQKEDTIANAQGQWNTNFTLNEGDNSVKVQAVDSSGNISTDVNGTVKLDTQAPTLTISTPEEGTSKSGKKAMQLEIKGSTDPDASVKVNDRIAVVNPNGEFSLMYNLSEGDNALTIIATDRAGNITQEVRHVTFTP